MIGLMPRVWGAIATLTLLVSAGPVRAETTLGALMEAKGAYYKAIGATFSNEVRNKKSGTTVIVKTPPRNKMARCNSARRFVAVGVELIATFGPDVTRITTNECEHDVVYAVVDFEPFRLESGEVTGAFWHIDAPRLVSLVAKIKPISRLAVVINPKDYDQKRLAKILEEAGKKAGYSVITVDGRAIENLSMIETADAVYVGGLAIEDTPALEQSAVVAMQKGIPVVTGVFKGETKGALMALYASPETVGKTAADIAIRLLGGADPEDVPKVKGKVELVLNLEVARAMGLKIPAELKSAATRVEQ